MSQAFGDERLEQQLRAVLDERAESVAAHARSASEIAADLAPRLRVRGRPSARPEQFLRLLAIAALLVALLAYLVIGVGRPRPPIELWLAIDLPFGAETGTQTIVDAVRLAIDRNAVGGRSFVVGVPAEAVYDHTGPDGADEELAVRNVRTIVGDPRYVAMIGPFTSLIAEAEIPIANEAGLLQCSPSNTKPGLTQGDEAVSLRQRPDRPSYVRVAATDDGQSAGAARFLLDRLAARSVFFVAEPGFGGDRTPGVMTEFERLGGTVAGTAPVTIGADSPELAAAQIAARSPDAVFYDGRGDLGARLLETLVGGARDLPFVSLDGILDGPRSAPGSFINLAGTSAVNAYAVFPGGLDRVRGLDVEAAYVSAFGGRPARHAFGGYACAEVILAALADLDLDPNATLADWREAIRAAVTASGRTYQTVLGDLSFDSNGDPQPARVSIYRVDGASGDWAFSDVVELEAGG